MAKKETQVTEFFISLDEFISGISKAQIETREAFAALMRNEKNTSRRPRSEWQRLYELFQKQPTNLPWNQWLSQNKGGK